MMKQPRIRSGQPESVQSVTTAMPMIATLTRTSLRADRNAALLREPPWWRTRASSQALVALTAIAPSEASTNGTTSGASGSENRCNAVQPAKAAGPKMHQGHGLAHQGTPGEWPAQGDKDQQIDRGVLEEVDAVREEGDRACHERDGELDEEVREVQDRHHKDNAPQPTCVELLRMLLLRPGPVLLVHRDGTYPSASGWPFDRPHLPLIA